MGLRAGANKATAKKQPFSDFKKKTAKVGRKVKGGNVTKIEVTSKRIQIPLQSQITAIKPESEQENLGLLLKTLQHYNGPARTTALEDLKELLANSPFTESYISLIFPPALELLFDEERDTRKALINLLVSLLNRYSSQTFVSIVPVTITYICSGLTSLNKGVRRDALSLLLAISHAHSDILIPHLEKLVSHALALLVDPSQSGGQDSLGSTSSAIFTSSGGSVSKAKMDDSWKKGSVSRKDAEGAKPSANQRPPLLLAVLEVIDAVLTSASQNIHPDSSSIGMEDCIILDSMSTSQHTQALLLRPLRRCSLQRKSGRALVKSVQDNGVRDDESSSLLSSVLVAALCHRLKSVWQSLILDSAVIAAHTIDVLILVAKISYRLGKAFSCIHTPDFKSLVSGMFFKFPHSSLEASLATPGSARERSSNLKISTMDLYLCDVALTFFEDQSYEAEAASEVGIHSKVNAFLLQKLQLYVEETSRELTLGGSSKNTNSHINTAMDIEGEYEASDAEEGNRDEELRSFTTSYSTISARLFKALEVVTLAAGRSALNASTDRHASSDMKSTWSMSELLNTLKELMSAFVTASASSASNPLIAEGAETKFSRRSLLAAVEPTLRCLFSIANDSSLWVHGYPEEAFTPLAEALAVISTLIQTTDSAEFITTSSSSSSSSTTISAFRAELTQLGEAYARALLSIVRRIPSSEHDAPTHSSNKALDLLSRSVMGLFKASRHTPSSSSSSSASVSKASKPSSFYQYSNTRTRYLLLDVFAHTPFGDVLSAVKVVSSAVSSAATSIDEQRYFLRIAFERRGETGAAEFIDQLFSTLRLNISSRCHGMEGKHPSSDASVAKKSRDVCGRWLAHDIADTLVGCSSAEAPERIISFVSPSLTLLAAPALEAISSEAAVTAHQGVRKWARGWMGSFSAGAAFIAVCARLVSPLLALTGDIDVHHEAMRDILTLFSRVCISSLVLVGDVSSEATAKDKDTNGQRKVSADRDHLLAPVAEALCMQSTTPSSGDTLSVSLSISAADRYFLLAAVQEEIKRCWPSLSAAQRCQLFLALSAVFSSKQSECVAMRVTCSEKLVAAVTSVISLSDVTANQTSVTNKNMNNGSSGSGSGDDVLSAGRKLLDILK